jgi:hypothetical protein
MKLFELYKYGATYARMNLEATLASVMHDEIIHLSAALVREITALNVGQCMYYGGITVTRVE